MNDSLPAIGDLPAGTEFVIKEFDVPLVRHLDGERYNWFGGYAKPYDLRGMKVDNNWPADSFDHWLRAVKKSLE